MSYRPFAGIGSRETPVWALKVCRFSAHHLATLGYTLRSGGAPGADQAFEGGCRQVEGNKREIYLPWRGFENNPSPLHTITQDALDMALHYHPRPDILKSKLGVWKLMARNCYQLLGPRLDSPADFVMCYTVGGSGQGGTAQALRIAEDWGITVFDIGVGERPGDPTKPALDLAERLNRFLTNLPVYAKRV